MPAIYKNGNIYGAGGGGGSADSTTYDNTQVTPSGQRLSGNNVQDAIDEVVERTWEGTLAQYNAITTKDPNTIYYVTDTNADDYGIGDLNDVVINNVVNNEVLTYNSTSGKWVNADTKADRVPLPAEYSSTATYNVGDFCTHDSNIYWCSTKITTPEAWTSYHWTLCNAQQDYLHSINPVGNGSFSMNRKSGTTIGLFSFAAGQDVTASGSVSHAEGYYTTASGADSHAEGRETTANGTQSHAEGYCTTASGRASHAEGFSTTASVRESHAEGYYTTASGYWSHSEGRDTIANHKAQHTFGEFNIEDPSTASGDSRGNYVEIVGNGTANDARSNARTLDWSGNEVLSGKLTATAVNTGSGDVTLSSKTAAYGGTDLSLVTTGEKYDWNSKAQGYLIRNMHISSSAPGVISNTGGYATMMVLGFAQSIGAVAVLIKINNNSITSTIDMFTGSAFSSAALTFSYSSSAQQFTISSTAASTSVLTVIKAGL